MRKLKIVYISSGTNDYILPYVDYFQRQGHQVYLFSYDSRDVGMPFRCPVYDISYGAHGRKKTSKWRYPLGAVKAGRLLRRIRPDILHGHYITSSGVIAWISGFRPYLLTAHGSDVIESLKSRWWRFVLPRILKRAALVNPVSDDLARRLTEIRVPPEKLFTATLGVDTDYFRFQPRRSTGNPWRLLCIRALKQVYDPQTILRACAILRDRWIEFEITFAADGPMREELTQFARKLDLDGRVKFLGGYDNANLPDMLHSYDIYVSASLWDGTSISLLEAMAAGIFPVVSRITANTALLEDGRTAMMFDCGNEQELAEAIIKSIHDSDLRDMAVKTNRQRVLEKADRKTNMQAIERKYYEIVGL